LLNPTYNHAPVGIFGQEVGQVSVHFANSRLHFAVDSPARSPADWLAPLTLEADHLGDVPSASGQRASDKGLLSMSLDEYLKLLDWAGRQRREGKQGAIPADLAPILERLGLAGDEFLDAVAKLPQYFPRLAGPVSALVERAREIGRRWLHGVGPAAKVFRQS
jgi:hypothetical protein